MSFGDKLRSLIEERGITQKELAGIINIAPSTMGCYVQNIREPDFATLKMLAEFFDVSIDYLLERRDKRAETPLEDDLLRVFRALSPEQRQVYLEQGKAIVRFNARDPKRYSASTSA